MQPGEDEPVRNSRQQTQFYEMLIEAETDQATLREYKKMKNPEDVASYRDAHAQQFGEEKIPTPVSEKVGKINSQIELVLRSHTTGTATEKAEIDGLLNKRQEVFRSASAG